MESYPSGPFAHTHHVGGSLGGFDTQPLAFTVR
jgi:hypothetical protein